jgi:arylsulfatase
MQNLLLVSLDTLRADVAYSGRFSTIEGLRGSGTSFRFAVASAPFTPVSHATILTGLDPPAHGIRHLFRESLRDGVPTLAETLARHGYETGAVVSCPGLNRFYGLNRGFAHYDDEIPLLPDGRDPLTLVDVKVRGSALKRAPLVVERAHAWLHARNKASPFFLFVHFFDAHWPYEPPEQYGAIPANPYEGEVAYMDKHLGSLLDVMRCEGLLDNTLLVFLSDHGEDLGGWYPNDHAGDRGHPEEEGHGALLFDTTLLVPLIFAMPGVVPASREVDVQVRLCDVAPTVLDLLSIPALASDGVSLRAFFLDGPTPAHRPAYAETFYREELAARMPEFAHFGPMRALRLENRLKIILEERRDRVEIHDLTNDPAERHPNLLRRPGTDSLPATHEPVQMERLPVAFAGNPLLCRIAEAATKRLGQWSGLGIALAGSAASGLVGAFSDIDLHLALPDGMELEPAMAKLRDDVASIGKTLVSYRAAHLGRPELLITLLEVEGEVVKIDVEMTMPGVPHPPGIVWLRPPRNAIHGVTAAISLPNTADLYARFSTWAWYAHSRLSRGDLFESRAALDVMRESALLPVLQIARCQPLDGYRRFEERFSRADRTKLDATFPVSTTAAELRRALQAMLTFFDAIQATAAARSGIEHRAAMRLDKLAAHVARAQPA